MSADTQQFESFLARHFNGMTINGGLEARLSDLKLDSLDLLDFILELENSFGISVDIDSLDEKMTLREIQHLVVATQR